MDGPSVNSSDPTTIWSWYSTKVDIPVRLDFNAYPVIILGREALPWPSFGCRAPDGGIHQSASIGAINVNIAAAPSDADEYTWTYPLGVTLIAQSWLDPIRDLLDPDRTFLGLVAVGGKVLENWSTIHEVRPPILKAEEEGRGNFCPRCGFTATTVYRRPYFTDPETRGRPLIMHSSGLMIREDIVQSRKLRTPRGSHPPGRVRWREA